MGEAVVVIGYENERRMGGREIEKRAFGCGARSLCWVQRFHDEADARQSGEEDNMTEIISFRSNS